jgi:hypothetical protein
VTVPNRMKFAERFNFKNRDTRTPASHTQSSHKFQLLRTYKDNHKKYQNR